MSRSMHCPIHGTTRRASDHDDFDVACPECRQVWSARGSLYELPRRDHTEKLRSPGRD
jgi:Zn-finger nucleic acid-binding protein